MNPAWSVVFFTTTAGAGQGLAVVLALALLAGVPLAPGFVALALGCALALLLAGLASSFLHLGHPERAWRAMAMWRTSWLSREVIVLPAFVAAVALWWWLGPRVPGWWLLLCVALALLLWWCTGMIYACLRFIQEWAHPLTLAGFVLMGLASGSVACGALASLAGQAAFAHGLAPWALVLTLAALAVRWLALRRNATLVPKSTLQSATGIQAPRLQQRAMGMTGGAYNTREFFHGRAPALLRQVKTGFVLLAFVGPALLLLWALAGSGAAWVLALLLQAPGLVAERWFFFAQARHPQNLYYQFVS